MLRKAAFALALVPLLAAGADAREGPSFMIGACPDAAMGRALPPVQRLFSDHPETRAVLILQDNCRALKAYAPGYSDNERFVSWSMAKTITGLLIGALVHDGKLKLDAPAPVAEWHKPGDPRAAITLRQMMQMSSGLEHVEVGDPVERSDTNQTLFVRHTDAMAAAAIAHPLERAPGTEFKYSSLTSLILSEIITRTLTPSRDPRTRALAYQAFANARLFGPAGIRSAKLEFDGAGTQIGGSLIYMTLDDWGRIGTLLLDGKNAAGEQVVDPVWLAFMKTPATTDGEYGAQLWLNRRGLNGESSMFPGKGPDTAVAAEGHLGQYVIASPDSGPGRGVVIVRLGNTPEPKMPALMQTLGDVLKVFDRR